jgi:hypothetical protein
MSIVKSVKAKTFAGVMAVSAMVLSVPARADWVADVKSGLDTAFANTQSIAAAVVVGFAVIFGIKLAKSVMR